MKRERKLSDARDAELRSLERGGVIKAEDVVEFAKDPKTALHSAFPWDVKKAAYEHWLQIARSLIVMVRFIPREDKGPVRAYVSLKSDRKEPGGGYRQIANVLSDAEMREELLRQAMDDFQYWQQKYHSLTELIPIFEAAKRVGKKRRASTIQKPNRRSTKRTKTGRV